MRACELYGALGGDPSFEVVNCPYLSGVIFVNPVIIGQLCTENRSDCLLLLLTLEHGGSHRAAEQLFSQQSMFSG